ncbi:MAG TPA: DMT family transporter [Rhodocyclaceae bacterium]|nr:EamA family transporter [Rhodocyclaceae bacterium]HMV55217.1 DMT family transporter [Rhodocyclaceae bacterium]HNB79243.1 DMT family transporter [Rhodocyclaceae bacterium]HNC61911.1 DMT family transporter [Rhodocyclaceae bacterium]HNH12540.1 DMT family transporter [Rhodocyclaceae bacterium]
MSLLALSLVLASAFGHATWNYWLKTRGGGLAFVWLFATAGCAIYLPLAAALAWHEGFVPTLAQGALIVSSGLLHTGYYLLLDRGYRSGDFSLVYPLARATGPLLTLCVAIALLDEQPSPLGLTGIVTIIGGAFVLTGGIRLRAAAGARRALGYALATGVMIAAYTLNDRQAVATLMVPPLIFDWSQNLVRVVLLAPRVLKDRAALQATWRERRKAILVIAVLCPLTYILVLAAMQIAPVSYVAAARELSILFGTLMGAHLLREADSHRRVAGAVVMVAGFVALAFA